jgi:hypothetical protein
VYVIEAFIRPAGSRGTWSSPGGSYRALASRPGSTSGGSSSVRISAARATSAQLTDASGLPFTDSRPSPISMSSGDASSMCAAISAAFARISAAARCIDPPTTVMLRLPQLPSPYGARSVSPITTRTWSIGTPSSSAASVDTIVTRLWP